MAGNILTTLTGAEHLRVVEEDGNPALMSGALLAAYLAITPASTFKPTNNGNDITRITGSERLLATTSQGAPTTMTTAQLVAFAALTPQSSSVPSGAHRNILTSVKGTEVFMAEDVNGLPVLISGAQLALFAPTLVASVLAANNTRIPDRQTGIIGGAYPATYKSEHYASPQGTISNIQLVYANWFYNTSTTGQELSGPSSYTAKHFIEAPSGTFTAVPWSGTAIGSFAIDSLMVSDVIPGLTLNAGSKFWVSEVMLSGSSTTVWGTDIPIRSDARGAEEGCRAGDWGNSVGGIAFNGSQTTLRRPAAIIGNVAGVGLRAFIIAGDSICALGQNDNSGVGAKGANGYLGRWIDPYYPHTRFGRAGQTLGNLLTDTTRLSAFLALLNGKITDAAIEHGGNDVFSGSSAATASSRLASLCALMPASVTKKHVVVNNPFGTTSSNAFIDVAGQTAHATNPVFTQLRDLIIAPAAYVTGTVLRTDLLTMSAAGSGLWATPGGIAPCDSPGGTHPTTATYVSIAAGLPAPNTI